MRNLDATNPAGIRPSKFTSFGAGLSVILLVICIPFAWGAAPEIPLVDNPVVRLLLILIIASLALSLTSIVFKWDWKAKYFGTSMLCIGSVSLLALVPLAAILLFGTLSATVKILIFLSYLFSHIWWCQKFIVLYKHIFNDDKNRHVLYQEDSDVVYYMRRGDNYLLEKYYKFSQMPPSRYFVIFIVLGLMMIPVMGTVRYVAGVPFAHVFLTVSMLPVSWMSIGLAVRGILVCYHYPAQIKKATGKEVYVDLITNHIQKSKK